MRKALNRKLMELASEDKNVMLLTADVGFKVFKEFRANFPDQFINVGIAEANMIGMASGLALSNKTVFVYSIASFASMRCFEQIRVDLCYQNLPVKIIGGGAGLVYGTAGATHQAIEDIGVMSSIPNMTVIAPGDPIEVELAVEKAMTLSGPCYIRIAKNGEKAVHNKNIEFQIGKAIEVLKGRRIVLVSTGNMLNTAMEVRSILSDYEIDCGVVSFHTIKPIDYEQIVGFRKNYELIVSIEEHSIYSGLGSRISNVITDYNLNIKLMKFGILDEFPNIAGDQYYLREHYSLLPNQISSKILDFVKAEVAKYK